VCEASLGLPTYFCFDLGIVRNITRIADLFLFRLWKCATHH
jgi:hypothetical protein